MAAQPEQAAVDAVRARQAPGRRAPARAATEGSRSSGQARGRRRAPGDQTVAGELPVARVLVDMPLAHLDRPFDYLVPERLAGQAVPGCRVRVRFAGQLTGGYVLERVAASDHPGRLAALERVVSAEPVLTPEIAALAREVADRYAGTMADVLRLAIPPRHAKVEAEASLRPAPEQPPGSASTDSASTDSTSTDSTSTEPASPGSVPSGAASAGSVSVVGVPGQSASAGGVSPRSGPSGSGPSGSVPSGSVPSESVPAGAVPAGVGAVPSGAGRGVVARPGVGSWARYSAGVSFLDALAAGRAPRAVWSALPGQDWPEEIARAAGTAAAAGRGALVVVPDARDLSLVDAALAGVLGPGGHVCLSAGLGPAERYRRWLAVARGAVRIVAGTRAAMFAPVRDLGLVVVWDDGDDLHAEPRAPYPHAREVLALRAHRARAGALIGGFARTAEATSLISSGWAAALAADRQQVRRFAPQVRATGDDSELARDEAARSARIPSLALRTAREALARGPVLVQVPRRGYLTAVACEGCRAAARCTWCGGPLAVESAGAPACCRWCGRADPAWRCPTCGHGRVRAVVAGARRTAEELGRAFPGVPVTLSGGSTTVTSVPDQPVLVVATPGAEPYTEGGYAAAVLLDSWVLLGRPSLSAAQETLRRWLNAAALVAPGPSGGTVILVADAALATSQAMIRWDPVTHAERELAEREALRFPPAVRMAAVTGVPAVVQEFLAEAVLPAGAEILGPIPVGGPSEGGEDKVQALIRVARPAGFALATALRTAAAARTARKQPGSVRVRLDPTDLI